MFDSVYVFAIGLQSIYPLIHLSNLTCEDEVPWNGGLSLINFINAVKSNSIAVQKHICSYAYFICKLG